ncbi:MAG: hypothetical protein Q7R41_09430 [Phycisphaerales bacterium]|nr:hypothetical protein [Phycisphaerales bacterium]
MTSLARRESTNARSSVKRQSSVPLSPSGINVPAVADILCNLTYGTIVAHTLTGRRRELVRQTNLIMDMFQRGYGK